MTKPNLHLVGPPVPPKPRVHVINTPLPVYRGADRLLASAQRIKSACSRAFMTETTLDTTLVELEFLRDEAEALLGELRPQKSPPATKREGEVSRR